MKRQVRVMLKEKKRLKKILNDRHLQLNKPILHLKIYIAYIFITMELEDWR